MQQEIQRTPTGVVHMPRPIVGVMGPGEDATAADLTNAARLGELLARDRWVILTGGMDAGVMREVSRGAHLVPGSLTVGILPSASSQVAPDVDIAIVTEMHNARNNINVLSSRVVIACGSGGPGTASEVALALKAGKSVILLGADQLTQAFYRQLGGEKVRVVSSPEEAVVAARQFLPR
jgi:uncharacterized protein (TIGR00725 family)